MSKTTIIVCEDTFHKWERHATEHSLGAIDIETTVEENPWANPPTLVSVAVTYTGRRAFVFANDEWLQRAKPLLEAGDWIMHNGLFDKLMMSYFYGIELNLTHDTMAMQYLLDPDEPKGLQILSEKYLGLAPYKDVDYKNILDEPFEKVAEMNAEDTRRTFALLRPLADQLNADPALSRVYQWILLPAIDYLIEITKDGIPLNTEKLAVVTEKTEAEVAELLDQLREATPAPDKKTYPKGWPKPSWWRIRTHGQYEGDLFNPGSWQQVGHILFDLWGLEPLEWNTDAEGNPTTPSTNADVLLRLETYHTEGAKQDWLHSLRAYRKATKLLSYFTAWPAQTDADGWLHPRYKPLHVVTGRLSSDSPNIQNVPRSKEVRECFGDVEGYTWIKADYSQIELRLAALAAGESRMLEAYREGRDLHTQTGLLVLGAQDEMEATRMLIVRAGLQPNRTSAEVLRTLWEGSFSGIEPEALLQLASEEWPDPEAGGRLGRQSAQGEETPNLQEWDRFLPNTQEDELRAMWKYATLVRASHQPRQDAEHPLKLEDVMSLMSCEGTPFGAELRQGFSEKRQVGKTLGFGLLYGAGPATLQRVARNDYGVFLTLAQARHYRDEFFRAYPGLKEWHMRMEGSIEATGVARSPMGRVRYLPKAKIPAHVQEMWSQKMGAIREGINHVVQSYASDILLHSLIEVAPVVWSYGGKVVAEVHDEMDFLVPHEHVETVAEKSRVIMEDTSWMERFGIRLGVPLVADVEAGPNWGNLGGTA